MTSSTELEPDVIAELNNGRKIAAIKKLRASRNIGLKEAKELVDEYLATHPETSTIVQKSGSGSGLGVLVIGGIAAYFIYTFIFKSN